MTTPFVKAYRYRLRPDGVDACLDAWRRAQEIYARHVPMTSVHLRSTDDPAAWLELNVFPDEQAYLVEAALADPSVENESYEEVARFP